MPDIRAAVLHSQTALTLVDLLRHKVDINKMKSPLVGRPLNKI